jgi:tetratricopeptide (TPR) repeat protein
MKHKSKKKTILLVLAVMVVVGLPVSYYGAREVLKYRIKGWRADGIAASKAGDHPRASELLVRYLQRRPEDIEALSYYIKSREKAELPNGQHLAETIGALKIILGLDPSRVDDRRHLLDLYVKLDRRPEALDTADAILYPEPNPGAVSSSSTTTQPSRRRKDGPPKPDVRTLDLKTQILMRMQQNREALIVAEQWAAIAPDDVNVHIARLSLRARLEHAPQSIIDDAAKLRAAHPDDPKFELLQGYAYAQTGDDAQAAKWLKTAASRQNTDDAFAKLLVEQFDAMGMSEDSLALLQNRLKQGGGAEIRKLLARRLWEAGRWEQTAATLQDLDPGNPEADATLAAFKTIALANTGKAPEAEAARTALASRNQAAARAWVMVLRRIIDAAVLDDKQVIAECQSALTSDPQNTYLSYFLGDAYARLGELDLAIQAWRRAAGGNPGWGMPANRLVEALIQKGRPEQAFMVASTATRGIKYGAAANANSVISLARAWAAGVQTGGVSHADELLKLVTEVQKDLPGEDQTLLIQIQLLGQQENKAQATKIARAAVDRNPPASERLLLALASVSRKYGLALEKDCFARSEAAHGLSPSLAYSEAIDRLIADKAESGLALFDELAKRSGKANDVRWQVVRAQYLDITANPGAAAAWIALGDGNPKDATVQQSAAEARAVRGDWDFMQRTVERLKALTGDQGLTWRMAKARLMVEAARNEADYEQGSVLLNEVIRENPQLPEPRVLLAKALVEMKRMDGAIEQMTTASKLDPTSVPIAVQLAALLQSRGDFERVRQELDRVSPFMRSAAQRRQAALMLAQQGNREQAVKLLEDEQKNAGGGEGDLLLAMLYARRQQFDKVEPILTKLLEKPQLPTIQFAATYYVSQGRRPDAEKALARLDGMKLEPGVKEQVLGGYQAQIGNAPEAIKYFSTATEKAPANAAAWRSLVVAQTASGRISDALATVEKATSAVPNDKSFAVLKQHSGLFREAAADEGLRPLLVAIARDPGNSDSALELLRVVSESRTSHDLEKFASRLQQLAERRNDFLPVYIQLAQCYLAMSRTSDAVSTAQRSMNMFPNSPDAARAAVQVCAAARRWPEMQAAAQVWKKRSSDEPIGPDLAVARAFIGLRRFDAAVSQLQPYAAKAQGEPDRLPDVVSTYALALVGAGRAQAARDLIWPLTSKAPAWRVRAVQITLEIPDQNEAQTWLEHLAGVTPEDALTERVMIAEVYDSLGRRQNDKALIQKGFDRIKQVTAHPQATAITFLAAGAQAERVGDTSSAESFYRRALDMDKNLWVAHNNLAMLITRRGGDAKEAMDHASAALKLQPYHPSVHDTYAQIAFKSGNFKEAAASMRESTKLDPDNPAWRIRLARYLVDGGDVAEAARIIDDIDARRLDLRSLDGKLREQLEAVRKQVKGTRPGSKAA